MRRGSTDRPDVPRGRIFERFSRASDVVAEFFCFAMVSERIKEQFFVICNRWTSVYFMTTITFLSKVVARPRLIIIGIVTNACKLFVFLLLLLSIWMHVTLLLNARYFSDWCFENLLFFRNAQEKNVFTILRGIFLLCARLSLSLSLYIYRETWRRRQQKKRRGRKKKMGLDLDSCIERVRARRVFARLSLPLSLSRARFFLHLFFSL